MKKICMVTTSEIFHDTRILNEARTLAKRYQVTILARKYPGQKSRKINKITIKLIDYPKTAIFLLNIIQSLSTLAKAAARENSDVFHAHDLDGLLVVAKTARKQKRKLIYDSHELWSKTYPFANLRGIQWLLGPMERYLMRSVDAGITVNDSIARYLEERYQKKFLSLRNCPVIEAPKNKEKPRKTKKDQEYLILHLGAADEGRGLEQMIEAMKYLPKNYHLRFLGGGKTEAQAKMLAKKLNLQNRIDFLPPVAPEKIIEAIKLADLGLALTQNVSLSYYLSLPNKIFQYLAAKVPILGSNFPEFRKIILKNKIGEVVDPGSPEKIATKIQLMMRYRTTYRRAYQKITDQYSWRNEEQKLFEFYRGLI